MSNINTEGAAGFLKRLPRRIESLERALMKARIPRLVTSALRPDVTKFQPGVRLFETDTDRSVYVNHDSTAWVYDGAAGATPAAGTGYTDEQARDAVAAMFGAGSHTGITFVTDDAGDRISATVTAQSSSSGGSAAGSSGLDPFTGFYHANRNGVLPGNTGAQNTANLQSLLNSIPTAFGGSVIGGVVVIPAGRYSWSGTVRVPKGVKLIGMSGSRVGTEGVSDAVGVAFIVPNGVTLLQLNDSTDGSSLVQGGPTVQGINFYGTAKGGTGTAIYAPNVNRWTVRDCGFKWCGVGIDGDSRADKYAGGDCSWWQVDNCTWIECGIGTRCLAASGQIVGGDITDCGIGVDLYGVSAPMKVTGLKGDIGAGGIGIRCRAYNCMFVSCYFEVTANGAMGMQVGPDPAISYSGNDNIINGCGFYGRGSAPQAIGVQILSGANRTKIVAPILALNAGYKIQDSGSGTVTLAA